MGIDAKAETARTVRFEKELFLLPPASFFHSRTSKHRVRFVSSVSPSTPSSSSPHQSPIVYWVNGWITERIFRTFFLAQRWCCWRCDDPLSHRNGLVFISWTVHRGRRRKSAARAIMSNYDCWLTTLARFLLTVVRLPLAAGALLQILKQQSRVRFLLLSFRAVFALL